MVKPHQIGLSFGQGLQKGVDEHRAVLGRPIPEEPTLDECDASNARAPQGFVPELDFESGVLDPANEDSFRRPIPRDSEDVRPQDVWAASQHGKVEIDVGVEMTVPGCPQATDLLDLRKRADNTHADVFADHQVYRSLPSLPTSIYSPAAGGDGAAVS
jgi:hypothetical protein